MDLCNMNYIFFLLQEKYCVVFFFMVLKELSLMLENKSSVVNLKSCIKNVVVIFCDLLGF